MVNISSVNGVVLFKLNGSLNKNVYQEVKEKLDYLLYEQGMNCYIFDFTEIKKYDRSVLSLIETKITEIFLNCGRVVMCGLETLIGQKIKNHDNRIFYVNNEFDAVNYIKL